MSEALRYRELDVPPALTPYIRCIWRMYGDGGAGPAEPIIPDGCAELVLNRADAFIRQTREGSHHQPARLVAGQITRAIAIAPSGRVDLWGVRFQPWGAAPWLGFAGVEMRDCLTSLDDLAPTLDRELSAFADACTEQDQHEALVKGLERHHGRARATDRRLPRLMQVVAEHREPFTVRALARHVGLSVRRVQLLFREEVGLSPIQAHRIARFQRALGIRRAQPWLTWSAVAARAGYYDQAHLIHDARGIADQTPAELLGDGEHELTAAFLSS
jgi:AraC-like DNA-binding protein